MQLGPDVGYPAAGLGEAMVRRIATWRRLFFRHLTAGHCSPSLCGRLPWLGLHGNSATPCRHEATLALPARRVRQHERQQLCYTLKLLLAFDCGPKRIPMARSIRFSTL